MLQTLWLNCQIPNPESANSKLPYDTLTDAAIRENVCSIQMSSYEFSEFSKGSNFGNKYSAIVFNKLHKAKVLLTTSKTSFECAIHHSREFVHP